MRRSHRMCSGAWRQRTASAMLSLLLAVALTLAGAAHALPHQSGASSSPDRISKAEAFVPWICGPGTSKDPQAPDAPFKRGCPACTLAKAPGLLQDVPHEPVAVRRILSTLWPLQQDGPALQFASSNPPVRAPPLS